MKDNIIQVIKLVIVCMVAAAILALVYSVTKEPIEKAIAEETVKAVKAVISGYDDNMTIDTSTVVYEDQSFKVFTVKNENEELVGRSIVTSSRNGYGGTVEIMLGVDTKFTITGIYVLSHKETPGLGSKMDEPWFKDQFKGTNQSNFIYKVEKDGGDVEAITSATITSRAVSEAVDNGLCALETHFGIETEEEIPADSIPRGEEETITQEVSNDN